MATPSFRPYESLYGVGILDVIHNYFPGLLYEPTSFQTVPEVLAYVQLQTRRRFDLFSVGRAANIRNNPRVAVPLYRPARFVYSEENVPTNAFHNVSGNGTTDLLINLFNTMMNSPINPNFMNPVIVRPSAEIIAANTTLSTVEDETNDACAVCQDGYEVGNERRSLNACHHTFHKSCIDTWLQENVHCPVCRHDIRIPTVSASTAPSSDGPM
jgi:hypothetical protein